MSEKQKTIYCGSGKRQSETWIKATINVDKIKDHIEEFKGARFVRLNINLENQENQFGKDVNISIDKFVPESKDGNVYSGKAESGNQPDEKDDDLPF